MANATGLVGGAKDVLQETLEVSTASLASLRGHETGLVDVLAQLVREYAAKLLSFSLAIDKELFFDDVVFYRIGRNGWRSPPFRHPALRTTP